jgi:acetoin utilization protein AcuB
MKNAISEYMTKTPHTIGDDQPLSDAKHLMAEHSIRHLPVLHGGRCVGILSDRDIKLAHAVEHDAAARLRARDVCSGEVYAAKVEDSLGEVATQMAAAGIGSAVIVDNREHVVGIFTSTDACRVLGTLAARELS